MHYRLTRRDGVRERPAWWNVGGTAFHEAVREWETLTAIGPRSPSADDAAERFRHHLAEATAAQIIDNPEGGPVSGWRCGGRVSAQYPNKEDHSWWADNGPEMVAKYVLAQEGRDCEILRLGEAGETLALEVGFLWHLDEPGAASDLPPLKGFIDEVLYFPRTDSIIVRDLKSGSHTPVDTLQLKVYRLALERNFGITAKRWWGDYWMARKGAATKGVDLTDASRCEAEIRYRLHAMDMAESLNLYPPIPGQLCSSCGVKSSCPAMSDEPFALWKHGHTYDRPGLLPILPVVAAPSISE
jgi:hypothetical protein